jgi:hypothetical protein
VLQARDGRPYRQLDQDLVFPSFTGRIDRTPAFVQLDLRAEKAFSLGGWGAWALWE